MAKAADAGRQGWIHGWGHPMPRRVLGASGMLAGRAIWSDVAGADDPGPLLRERAGPRLRRLAEIVDAHGVPWHERGGAAG